jgi:hypothetical protein
VSLAFRQAHGDAGGIVYAPRLLGVPEDCRAAAAQWPQSVFGRDIGPAPDRVYGSQTRPVRLHFGGAPINILRAAAWFGGAAARHRVSQRL